MYRYIVRRYTSHQDCRLIRVAGAIAVCLVHAGARGGRKARCEAEVLHEPLGCQRPIAALFHVTACSALA